MVYGLAGASVLTGLQLSYRGPEHTTLYELNGQRNHKTVWVAFWQIQVNLPTFLDGSRLEGHPLLTGRRETGSRFESCAIRHFVGSGEK